MMTDSTPFLRASADDFAAPARAPEMLQTSQGAVRLSRFNDISTLEAMWRKLELRARCSYAQTFACAKAWSETVLKARNGEPEIIVGSTANGQLNFIWPFEADWVLGQKVLRWLGQKHNNYNMGLFDPAFARALTDADMVALTAQGARMSGASALLLEGQPESWDGEPNPFAGLQVQATPNVGHVVELGEDFEALYHARFSGRSRSGLKRKEHRLAAFGAVRYGWATDPAERGRLLATFFAQKTDRFAELGQSDAFAASEHRAFYEVLSHLPETDPAYLHIGYVTAGDTVAATFTGTLHQGRFIVLFSSLAEGEDIRRCSPGALLIRHQIDDLCRRGERLYDMGAGDGRHKSDWCNIEQPLFDCMMPVTAAGALVTLPAALKGRAKRVVKNDPRLWAIYDGLRRRLYGRRAAAKDAA